ncbi:hypothetical protein [Streptomyces sp. NBC_01518]|uniref:hypothetical protein n=1 Tax=Streptomyces sp. NBC_01518 TaxID=2903891 RepID=UPI003870E685
MLGEVKVVLSEVKPQSSVIGLAEDEATLVGPDARPVGHRYRDMRDVVEIDEPAIPSFDLNDQPVVTVS